MLKKQKFGTVYINGTPVDPGIACPAVTDTTKLKIELGNTVPGKEITWVLAGNSLVADRNLLRGISWNTLYYNDLILGHRQSIDGQIWETRLLWGGRTQTADSEWASILADAGNDAPVDLHTEDSVWSWGSAMDESADNIRVAWGSISDPRRIQYDCEDSPEMGWRPVLELLEARWPELVGRQIACCTAWGDKIFGNLGELSEYDLVLDKLQTIALGEDCDDIKGLTNGSATLLKNGGLAIDLDYVTRLYPWDRI